MLQVIPLASLATYCLVPIAVFYVWPLVTHWILVGWAMVMLGIVHCNLALWWFFLVEEKWSQFNRSVSNLLVFNLALAAFLYAYFAIELFAELNDNGRVYLVGFVAAFAATGGWMFASLTLAGIFWSLLLVGTFGIGLLLTFDSYQLLASLAILYSLFLCATVMVTSHKFIQGLIFESKIEQQGELISLLLHEFEENISDWLWEIDNSGKLRHVSMQLVEVTNQTADELKERTLLSLVGEIVTKETLNTDKHDPLGSLENALHKKVAFKGILICVTVKEEIRWWSFKANPLFNDANQFIGWRGVTSDVTEGRNRELDMIRLATEDSLTGLANRHLFTQSLDSIMSNTLAKDSCFLMMLDLDNFKNVNDSLGHHAGDQLLCHLGTQLQSVKPEGALLARLGGDEFALIVTRINNRKVSPADAAELASKIRKLVAKPYNLHGHRIETKVSIGVSFAWDDAKTADNLLKAADIALYHAKEERNRVSFFNASLRQKALRKQTLLTDLQVAIEQQQFFLVYQPQYDLATNQVVSFEALVRWQHPSLGLIPPNDFIPLAESSRLIIPLGEWVLRQACFEAQKWPDSIGVAVNISAMQLEHSDLGEALDQALLDSGLRQQRLELELTESAIMHDSPRVLAMLSRFRDAGGRIAIDDFGTGFSSFSYLHSFPLDKLKIDGSFIDLLESSNVNKESQTIVNSIIQLGKALNLQVTAEGIETYEQQRVLNELSCDLGQGYLYSKPMQSQRIKTFLGQSLTGSLI